MNTDVQVLKFGPVGFAKGFTSLGLQRVFDLILEEIHNLRILRFGHLAFLKNEDYSPAREQSKSYLP